MSIFPSDYNSGSGIEVSSSSTPILLKEYAINFDTEKVLLDENNKFVIVEGIEAVKVRCWLALKIQRNRFLMYMDVGNNLSSLVGKPLSDANSKIQLLLNEALVDGIYVTSIGDVTLNQTSDKVNIDFTVNSIYGSYAGQASY
ncbi:MAG: DUF2634 domain-containing protein [Solirubrobacterales bacterium]